MKFITITGGIGSGKSYVCGLLNERGVHVYDCDAAAHRLMNEDLELQRSLQHLVGEQVFLHGELQKNVLAQYILASEANRQAVNDVVHPAVATDFKQSGYTWLESAILFDSGFDRRIDLDYRVCVTAPLDVRIERVMCRDDISRKKALEWIHRQMPQEDIAARCNFVIVNDGQEALAPQVERLLAEVSSKR